MFNTTNKKLVTPLKRIKSEYPDYDLPDMIDINYKAGIEFSDKKGNIWKTVCKDTKRKLTLHISSYVGGYCIEAEHYYGSLNIRRLAVICSKAKIKEAEKYLTKIKDGIIDYTEWARPDELDDKRIDIKRYVTKKDLEPNRYGEKKFEGYSLGDTCIRFNSQEEVIAEAIRIYKSHFTKDWELVLDSIYMLEDTEEIFNRLLKEIV